MPLTMLDEWFTAVAHKAETLGTRHSWRLGRWLREGVVTAHEILRRLSFGLGWDNVDVSLTAAAQGMPPKETPRYPALFAPEVSQRAQELLRGICTLGEGRTVKLESLTWRHDLLGQAHSSLRFRFHSLYWVKELLDAYHLTRNQEYLGRAKELTTLWISECLCTEQVRVWDDHCTALRAIIFCQLWEACRGIEPVGSTFMGNLLAALKRHGEKLAHESLYRSDHNHGVTQAFALMALGLLFPVLPGAQRWVKLGHSRLEAQMARNISCEGLHREHSPSYHFLVFRQFQDAYRLAKVYGVPFSREFTDRLQAMLSCGAHLLKPDGTLPALGDSSRSSVILVDQKDLSEWPVEAVSGYLYSRSAGARGIPPSGTSMLFSDAGYAFFRSGWGTPEPFKDERFLALRLSTFNTTHIHRDVFSFELYAYGDDLVVDSGGPFGYGESMRNFLLSTAAHNTVVVDGQDQGVGKSQVLNWKTCSEYDFLEAEHHNYSGVAHRRAVIFVRPHYFVILDRLVSRETHHYSQLFHLNPMLEADITNRSIATRNGAGGATVQIVPLLDHNLGLDFHRGVGNPCQGWVCLGHGKVVPNTVVVYRQTGTTVSFAVVIVPEPSGQFSAVSGHIGGKPLQEKTRVHISIGDRDDHLLLAPDGSLTLSKGKKG